jgi:hypothetical protein
MPERIELGTEEEETPKPTRRLSESEARRLLILRIAITLVALVVLIWVISFAAGRIGILRTAAHLHQRLQQGGPSGEGMEAQIRAFGAMLTQSQVRTLVGGGSLKYGALTPEQQQLFSSINPLPDAAGAPEVTPYDVRLDKVARDQWTLRLIWNATGTGQAVAQSVRIE